jgi:hypothetical protein
MVRKVPFEFANNLADLLSATETGLNADEV